MTSGDKPGTSPVVQSAAQALTDLGEAHPETAAAIARLVGVVAGEASSNARFARALQAAFSASQKDVSNLPARRSGRRAPGVLDPFAVYGESGASGLERRLAELSLEQLRDIIAEHGMDHDRLAMKWKDPTRVIDRIIEKVAARTSKGSAFRQVRES